jgi:hypothetical protein
MDPHSMSPSPVYSLHPGAMSIQFHSPSHLPVGSGIHHHHHYHTMQGTGMWDWADPNKNGVGAAFAPIADPGTYAPIVSVANKVADANTYAPVVSAANTVADKDTYKPGGIAEQFARSNIRNGIHAGVGTAISATTGVPLSGALAGQLGLNNAIDEGLDKANLGFGLKHKKARMVKGSDEAKAFMASIRKKKHGMKGGVIPSPHSRSYITDPSLI